MAVKWVWARANSDSWKSTSDEYIVGSTSLLNAHNI